jgi:energy-coupling factor transporter ATP-binding protein EcfA2
LSAPIPLLIEDLSFRYRTREETALQDVSLRVDPGELLLVAGASGCGKTTLARCINGLIPHSYRGERAGSVRVFGREVAELTKGDIARSVGTLLQDPERQIVGAFVINEVAFGLENLGVPREDMALLIDAVLRNLNVHHLRDRETFQLSGGEKQKVALAGALVTEPQVLVLDEPLASLDPASSLEALRLFRRLADEGKSVILVEHRVEEVLKIRPDRVLYLEDGRIAYLGRPDKLAARVDYHQVKLPAPMIIERAAADPPPRPVQGPSVDGREPLLAFDGVSFRYPQGPWVLDGVNLQVTKGEVVALLGPNGAGKTTLVKHALGLLKPNHGRVVVGGRDVGRHSIAQLAGQVGYVFQNPRHMLFAPTVNEELAFGPRNLNQSESEVRQGVRRGLQMLHLQGMEKHAPLSLSYGQQKRVTIAAVVAMGSKILVMDEPTAGQDYWNYMTFMENILNLPGFDAVIFITHDLDLAISYATRVVILSEGRVVADGRPEEVLIDKDLLERCRIVPTSLLEENIKRLPKTGRFMRAEALAHV